MYPRSYSSSAYFHFQSYVEEHKVYVEEHKVYVEEHKVYVEEHKVYEQTGGNMGEYNGKVLLLLFSTTHCSLKAYCASLVRRSNFRHQASPCVSPRESTQLRKVELWARNAR